MREHAVITATHLPKFLRFYGQVAKGSSVRKLNVHLVHSLAPLVSSFQKDLLPFLIEGVVLAVRIHFNVVRIPTPCSHTLNLSSLHTWRPYDVLEVADSSGGTPLTSSMCRRKERSSAGPMVMFFSLSHAGL